MTALRAFEAAARHLSFKAAADELSLTPSAISHEVRLLEDILGCSLFRRRPPPLALTEAGVTLFPVIRDGLDAFAAAAVQVRDGVAQQKLRVTTTNAFAGRWLVPRMPISVSAQSCGCTSTNNNEILSYMWRGTARPLHSKQQGLGMVAEEHPFRDCCGLDRETKSFRWELRI